MAACDAASRSESSREVAWWLEAWICSGEAEVRRQDRAARNRKRKSTKEEEEKEDEEEAQETWNVAAPELVAILNWEHKEAAIVDCGGEGYTIADLLFAWRGSVAPSEWQEGQGKSTVLAEKGGNANEEEKEPENGEEEKEENEATQAGATPREQAVEFKVGLDRDVLASALSATPASSGATTEQRTAAVLSQNRSILRAPGTQAERDGGGPAARTKRKGELTSGAAEELTSGAAEERTSGAAKQIATQVKVRVRLDPKAVVKMEQRKKQKEKEQEEIDEAD